jgi:hypothetical protein
MYVYVHQYPAAAMYNSQQRQRQHAQPPHAPASSELGKPRSGSRRMACSSNEHQSTVSERTSSALRRCQQRARQAPLRLQANGLQQQQQCIAAAMYVYVHQSTASEITYPSPTSCQQRARQASLRLQANGRQQQSLSATAQIRTIVLNHVPRAQRTKQIAAAGVAAFADDSKCT